MVEPRTPEEVTSRTERWSCWLIWHDMPLCEQIDQSVITVFGVSTMSQPTRTKLGITS